MLNKQLGKSLFFVAFSRLVSLLSSVVVGFLLPKIFSISDYGYFRVFTLYAVYTALLHFGFVDGILLKLAGKEFRELDREEMRTYTRFFIMFELVISFVMILLGVIFMDGEYFFIAIMLAINMVVVNVTTYYQFISQAVQRFNEYSAKSLIVSFVKLIFVGSLFIVYFFNIADISYRIYLLGLFLLDFFMMLWYVVIYKEITFGRCVPVGTLWKKIYDIFKTGIVLTLAYQVSHLVLALDRQFVNILFPTETFAIYSFAYNIVAMISTMISSISVVLLPMLKRSSIEYIIASYKKSVMTVSIIATGALLCYFPLAPVIDWFLPAYHNSLEYITIVLPAFLFTAVITVVMFTIAKVLDMNFIFFKDSCIVLFLGVLANTVAYTCFGTPSAISYASLVIMAIWFVLAGNQLKMKTNVPVYKEWIYLIVVSCLFLIVTKFIDNYFVGFICYFLVWVICSVSADFQIAKICFNKILSTKYRNV